MQKIAAYRINRDVSFSSLSKKENFSGALYISG